MLAVLGRSWAYVGGLGPLLGPKLAVLGRSWGLYGRSRARKCEEHGYLENMLISRAGARSAAWGSVLSCSWSLCWWSWSALGAYDGGLGLLLGRKLAVLGVLVPERSVLGLSGRSWEGIKAEKWPKPEREGRSGEGIVFPRFRCPDPPVEFFL